MNQDELRILEERIKANPKSRSFLQLAEAYIEMGRKREALDLLKNGEEFYPYYLAARITYGKLLREEGDTDGAIGQFEFVNRTIPDNLIALKNLAFLYEDREKSSEARSMAQAVLALSPGDPEMEELLSRIAATEGERIPGERQQGVQAEAVTLPSAEPEPAFAPVSEEPPALPETPVPEEMIVEFPQEIPAGTDQVPEEEVPVSGPESVPEPEMVPEPVSVPALETAPPPTAPERPGLPKTETMGDLLFDQGHLEEAFSIYESVLEKDPSNATVPEKIKKIRMMLRMLPEEETPVVPLPEPVPVQADFKRPPPFREAPSPPLQTPLPQAGPGPEEGSLAERIIASVSFRMSRDLTGYVLSSRDGLPVESSDSGRWADVLAAEGVEIVRAVADMSRTLDWGDFRGTMVWMDRAILYGIPIAEERALFLVLSPEANIGLLRLLVQNSRDPSETDGDQT